MPDYQGILERKVSEFEAHLFDIRSLEAMADSFDNFLRAQEIAMEGNPLYMGAWSTVSPRNLVVPLPVEDETVYAIALHELGHVVTSTPLSPPSIEEEARASLWALDNDDGLIQEEGAAILKEAIESYIGQEDNLSEVGTDLGPVGNDTHNLLSRLDSRIK